MGARYEARTAGVLGHILREIEQLYVEAGFCAIDHGVDMQVLLVLATRGQSMHEIMVKQRVWSHQ